MAKLIRDPELDRLVEELNSDQEPPLAVEPGEGGALRLGSGQAPRPVRGALAEWPPPQAASGNALEAMLIEMARRGASDLHVIAGSPPVFRVGGRLARGDAAPLSGDETQSVFNELMTSRVRE